MQIMQIEDKRMAENLNYKLCIILMQKGIVFIFANYLENVLVWNLAMGWFERGMEMVGTNFAPTCILVLNSLKFRLLPKNCQKGKL
jgi:hypothetical protein